MKLLFLCKECGCRFEFDQYEDPTTSSGSCKGCGGKKYSIYNAETGELVD